MYAFTNNDSTLVVRGHRIKTSKKATEPNAVAGSVAGYRAVIRVRLRHPSRFERPGYVTAKIKVAATDEFGQRATDEFEDKRFYLWPRP